MTSGERDARSSSGDALLGAVRDVGGVLLAWCGLVVAELVVVGSAYRGSFAQDDERALAGELVVPVALAMLAPAALVAVPLGHLAWRAGDPADRRARGVLAGAASACAAAVAVGVSTGRHFASLALRGAFVLALAALAFGVVHLGARPARRLFDGGRARTLGLVVGASGAALAWLVDAFVLPRLYAAFHALAFGLTAAFAALALLSWRTPGADRIPGAELAAGAVGLALACAAALWAPSAARRLSGADHVRLVLEEHAPILGRAVQVASWIAPAAPAPDEAPVPEAPPARGGARALDWSGADLLLVSIDALRADHLGAYGYGRPTTPNLDALAKDSALFEHAYCPTPSTSYSVTSMMTGKPMRPLLSMGLARDSETFATLLHRDGYETAAFYPPAIFYIDADRFTDLERSGLGFQRRSAKFASAEERVGEVTDYLAGAGRGPLFLWVHFYEPHEPYVAHPGHEFGDPNAERAVDVYDSEVAYTDASVGALLRAVRTARRGHRLVVVVTADHGEEFGEHGGRYHGTTCYEEQVRVPLLVSGPGVAPRRVPTVVQTIDLLPTVVSALGRPAPPRVRGRDLGELLAGLEAGDDPGSAYAETDDRTLLARGADRLLCARKIGACALYDVDRDPEERVDRAPREPEIMRELRARAAGIERDLARSEAPEGAWPDGLLRGMEGDADAAPEVAALLGDPSVAVRRKAAEVSARLAVPEVAPRLRDALARDADDEVRRWSALALTRMGDAPSPVADALVHDADERWRRAAALAFAARGDGRGKAALEAAWQAEGPSRSRGVRLHMPDAVELLHAFGAIHDGDVVPLLVESMGYYPFRPKIAEALGAIGDARAKAPLLAAFPKERYEPARAPEARALVALGAARDALPALTVLAGIADPMVEAIAIADEAKLLDARSSGVSLEPPSVDLERDVAAPEGATGSRLWVLARAQGGALTGSIDGRALGTVTTSGATHALELPGANRGTVHLALHEPSGIRAVWLVPAPASPP